MSRSKFSIVTLVGHKKCCSFCAQPVCNLRKTRNSCSFREIANRLWINIGRSSVLVVDSTGSSVFGWHIVFGLAQINGSCWRKVSQHHKNTNGTLKAIPVNSPLNVSQQSLSLLLFYPWSLSVNYSFKEVGSLYSTVGSLVHCKFDKVLEQSVCRIYQFGWRWKMYCCHSV